jgi:hypothetical protein
MRCSRSIQTGAAAVEVVAPQVDDRRVDEATGLAGSSVHNHAH